VERGGRQKGIRMKGKQARTEGTFLVTGGAGFIGSHLTETLAARGGKVRVLDDFSSGKKANIAPFADRIELLEGDIRDLATCRRAVEGVDFVLHQAAQVSVSASVADPLLTHEVNITGTLNLLLASREARVKTFLFASSAAVYGDDPRLPKREGEEGRSLSPYALSKRVGEFYCRLFNRIYGLATVCFRYFNIFGPRQDPGSPYAAVIPRFISAVVRGEPPTIFGDGNQCRDFLYVGDLVEAVLRSLGTKNVSGEIMNLASGKKTTVNELLEKIKALQGSGIEPLRAAARPGDIRFSYADISKIRELLRYEPRVSLEEGLRETIRWFRERNGSQPCMKTSS